jgi:D-tyrosyl-tRNA(Tyr) deacylase
VGEIGKGMLVLVACENDDQEDDIKWMANRLSGLRIFEDADGKMNLSCAEVGGSFLVVSNFTVAGDTRAGRRPSFTRAASFDEGKVLFERLIYLLKESGLQVETGSYGEEMAVALINDGPITLIVESPSG